ncbi:MAG: CHAT domain-containing tetratricopeptide repeat protein [Firmicutes bacterium]|nr:CHAT domain-containing tetratricopeptide repeat protein [Bacillota bacterium]MDH7495186.1 CHAT domain-containing tetratricopeptide repeat protein [Bacillota bacterium]
MDASLAEALLQIFTLLDQGKAEAALDAVGRCRQAIGSPPPKGNAGMVSGGAREALPEGLSDMPATTDGKGTPWTRLLPGAAAGLLWLKVAEGRALSLLSNHEGAEAVLEDARKQWESLAEYHLTGAPEDTAAQDEGALNTDSSGRALALLGLAACEAALGEVHHRKTEFRQALHHFRNALANYRLIGESASDAATHRTAAQSPPDVAQGAFVSDPSPSFARVPRGPGYAGDARYVDREIARVKVMMAESLMSCGEFAEAAVLSDEALATFTQCGDLAWRGRAAKAKGTVSWYQDRFNNALEWYERAEADLVQSGMLVQAAFVNNNRALVYWKINRPDEALKLFEKARPAIASAGMETEAATIDVNASIALASLGRTDEALELLDRAGKAFERLDVRQKMGWVEYYKGRLLAETGRHREAIERFASARTRFQQDESIDTYKAQASLYLGLCHVELGDLAQAREACQEALDVAAARDVPDLAYPALYGLARAAEACDPSRALDLYMSSIREIERMRQSLSEDRLKTSFVFDKTRVYDAAVSLARRLDRKIDALALVERAKSQAFVDWLKLATRSGVAIDGSPRVNGRPGSAPHPPRPLRGAGDDERFGLEVSSDPMMFADRALSDEDVADAIIEFYLLPSEALVFVITRSNGCASRGSTRPPEVQLVTVGIDRARIDDLIAWLYTDIEIMQSTPRSFVSCHMRKLLESYEDHARALYDALMAPVESLIAGKRRILILPHGPLHHVPFHVLHDGRRYVIDSHEVSLAPSLKALAAIWAKGRRAARTCLAVGVKDDAAPLAELECERVAELFGTGNAQLLLGEDATVQSLARNASGFDVVHIAGHAVFDPEDPMRSHIRLASGSLSASDIFETRMECALVMLSACQTGVAYVSSGDELLGLSRGVFLAGASSLVASLWKVNDESTVDLAVEFYRSLLAGRTKPEALRSAAMRMRRRAPHPYYWAPFVVLGDPRP